MTYLEIKTAIENGKRVYWDNKCYSVFMKNGKLYTKALNGNIMIIEIFSGKKFMYFIVE